MRTSEEQERFLNEGRFEHSSSDRRRRVVTAVCATIMGSFILVVGFFVWAIAFPHSPDLTRAEAARLITARPEFSRYARLVRVSNTTRGADSMQDCCYSADFIFQQNGSTAVIGGRAQFFYDHATWGFYDHGTWRLGDFSWDEGPNRRSVTVGR